jgi:hypothetical protein
VAGHFAQKPRAALPQVGFERSLQNAAFRTNGRFELQPTLGIITRLLDDLHRKFPVSNRPV